MSKKLYRPRDERGYLTTGWFDKKEDAEWWGKESGSVKFDKNKLIIEEKPMQAFYDEINTGKRKRLPKRF